MVVRSTLRLVAVAALSLAGVEAAAQGPDPLEAPTFLSAYKSYSEQVAAECVRNRAYGLTTNGLPLKLFCRRQGDLAAMKVQQDMTTPRRTSGTVGVTPPR
jgi:hypothetical protein